MDLGLAGKKAIVTGASRGIGRKVALTLAGEGASVALCARGKEALDVVADEARGLGVEVFAQTLDVSDEAAIADFVSASAAALGGLDILVSNVSGGGLKGPDQWLKSFEADLLPFVRLVEASTSHLEDSDAASIVSLGTISALDTKYPASPNSYQAFKAALIAHASGLGHSLAPKGIRVNSVSPGPTLFDGGAWDQVKQGRPEVYEQVLSGVPMGRLGSDADVANAVVFLASPAAGYITAANLLVDGGYVSRIQF